MRQGLAAILLLMACANDTATCTSPLCATSAWQGERTGGELGFRFSSPLDSNGDGVSDLAAGARFTDLAGTSDLGVVIAWSGLTGMPLLTWEGTDPAGLFGHAVATLPDLDGDGLADVVATAPNRAGGGSLAARSPATGRILWSVTGDGAHGWDMAITDDRDGDSVPDLFVGAPAAQSARVELRSGRTGERVRIYPGASATFGFYVASLSDIDGDGVGDLLVGAPLHPNDSGLHVGAAFAISSATGEQLRTFLGEDQGARFGENLTGVPDLDGDGIDDLAVGAPYTSAPGQIGQVYVFSSTTGALLHRLVGTQPGAIYGRMVARVLDVDGDGTDDLAIGAPWRRVDGMDRAGYFELRSGRTLELITSVTGTREDAWLGWHIVPAERMIDGTRHGVLVSSIMSEENGVPRAGRIELYELSSP